MSIGERRHRVTFQTSTIVADDFGEPDQSWSSLGTAWALVQPLKGAERFSANQAQIDVDYRIVTRNSSMVEDLSAGDRCTWTRQTSPETSITFDIRSVIWRDHRDKELELLCKVHD